MKQKRGRKATTLPRDGYGADNARCALERSAVTRYCRVDAVYVQVFPVLEQLRVWTDRIEALGRWRARVSFKFSKNQVQGLLQGPTLAPDTVCCPTSTRSACFCCATVRATAEVWLECGNGFASTQPYIVARSSATHTVICSLSDSNGMFVAGGDQTQLQSHAIFNLDG